ncbi:MAG TPA: ectonucleotide pyrophosphatase/phosphodiesterase [Anaerolineales bacterium]|nr:ectonucleotide pyrophosphatase/phosphodiesterase [Anaerolineales bacterium]
MRSRLLISILTLVFTLLSCSSPGAVPVDVLPSPFPTLTTISVSTATATPMLSPTETITATPAPLARRVLILSIDGLRPDAIALAPMPNLLALMQNSAHTLNAQTVFPSVTLVSHASMLGGVCPSKHGVDWNDYLPEKGFAKGTDLFDIAHAAGLPTVMYVGKEKLQQVTEPASVDSFVFINDRDLVITEQLLVDFPADFSLLFVHFPTPDWMGHQYGWMSAEQLSVIQRADEALGEILSGLDARGLRDETLIIISADHGGHDNGHGTDLPVDMTIPWIASGPGIQPKQLSTQVYTMDTAATAAFALGLPIPPEWDGVPVYEAFGLPVEKQSAACQ